LVEHPDRRSGRLPCGGEPDSVHEEDREHLVASEEDPLVDTALPLASNCAVVPVGGAEAVRVRFSKVLPPRKRKAHEGRGSTIREKLLAVAEVRGHVNAIPERTAMRDLHALAVWHA